MSDERFGDVPDQGANPVTWDPVGRRFVTGGGGEGRDLPSSPPAKGVDEPKGPDPRRFRVPKAAVGRSLPPQPGTPSGGPTPRRQLVAPGHGPSAPRAVIPAPGAPAGAAAGAAAYEAAKGVKAAPAAATRAPLPLPRRAPVGAAAPPPAGRPGKDRTRNRTRKGKLRRFLPNRPKLRTLIFLMPLLVPLLVVALLAGGLWYANNKFNELHRVPVGNVLDKEHGASNILLVGSDSRDLQGVASDASGIFGDATNQAPSGQRSDTMVVLRLDGSGAHTLSIPRDLMVTVAETDKRDRINSAYNTDLGGGPVRLIETVKANLKIPITRYMEVDFATFSGVVDAIGGIDIDFPHPAFDDNTGLNITEAGVHRLNGEQALEYVRSRHYTEVIDGRHVEDPTADLGRIKRQQAFLAAVFGKIGKSRNPITLLQVATEVIKGLRVDDKLGFVDALWLAWDLKGLHPQQVELPVAVNRDNATLHLAGDAESVLAQFR